MNAQIQQDLHPVSIAENRALGPFENPEAFKQYMAMARALASSSMVPKQYRGDEHLGDCLLALDMASRMKANPLMVMQNLHLIEGRPSWSSKFLIASVNSSGKFSPIRFRTAEDDEEIEIEYTIYEKEWVSGSRQPQITEKTMKRKFVNARCTAYATDLASNELLEGTTVDIGMAMKEGWYDRKGSKWQTMSLHMLRWRAAAFWINQYAPEMSMGIPIDEEARDIIDVTPHLVEPENNSKTTENIMAKARAMRDQDNREDAEPPKASVDVEKPETESEWPRKDGDGIWRDSRGIKYMPDIHGCSAAGIPATTQNGVFTKKRGCDVSVHARREKESLEALKTEHESNRTQTAENDLGADVDAPDYPEVRQSISRAVSADACDAAEDLLRTFCGSEEHKEELSALLEARRESIKKLTEAQ